ncbi:MAG TPA: hypothetical protein H9976_01355 [Candidatus Akkermansia intestinavium]|nr:hypothetical protein [Candidatus Akkermansia intestinavium]
MMNKQVDLTLRVNAEVDSASFNAARNAAAEIAPAAPAEQVSAESVPGGGEEAAAGIELLAAAEEQLAQAREQGCALADELAQAEGEVSQQREAGEMSAKRQAAASEQQARAASREKEEEEKLLRAMELAGKGRNALIAELERLAKARQQAAKAGNKEEFQRLTQQSAETREAFEKLNQGLELTNIQMTQQAQMGMMAGQTLANLGRAAAGGADDVAGMAAQVLSLGQAIKAGLGPIGWAMMLLEGVQAAWNAYSSAVKAHREAMEAELRIATEINDALAGLAKRQAERESQAIRERSQSRLAAMDKAVADEKKAREAQMNEALAAAEMELELQEQLRARREELLQAEVSAGTRSQKSAEEERRRMADEAARRREELETQRRRGQMELRRQDAESAEGLLDAARRADAEHRQQMGGFADAIGALDESRARRDLAEWDDLQATAKGLQQQIDEIGQAKEKAKEWFDDEETLERLRSQERNLEMQIKGIEARQQTLLDSYDEQIAAARGMTGSAKLSARDALEFALGQKDLGAQLADEVSAREASAKAARQSATAALRDEQLRSQYQERLRSESRELEERTRRMNQQAEAQQQLLEKIRTSLSGIDGQYRTMQSYERKRSLSEEEMMRADAAMLAAKESKLVNLLMSAQGDAELTREIQERLTATRRELGYLYKAWEANVEASRRWLRQLEPPELQSKSKFASAQLKRLEKAYAAAAKRVERASSRGDDKSVERGQRYMSTLERNIKRLAKGGDETEQFFSRTRRSLDVMTRGMNPSGASAVAHPTSVQGRRAAPTLTRRPAASALAPAVVQPQEQASLASVVQHGGAAASSQESMARDLARLVDVMDRVAGAATRGAEAASSGLAGLSKRLSVMESAVNGIRRV